MIQFTPERLLAFFRRSLERQALYHSSLLLDPTGLGETSLALKVAALLLCQTPSQPTSGFAVPCERCGACIKVAAGSHPDVIVIGAGEKKGIAVDQIREVIAQSHIKPWEGRYKVFIVEGAHRMSEEAANALLKTLEEPPHHTVFLLTAENEQAILPTILSRCQIFPIGRREQQDALATLTRDHNLSREQAGALLALSEGSFEAALGMVTTQKWEVRTKLLHSFLQGRDPIQAGEEVTEMCGQGEEARQKTLVFLDCLASFWRDVLICQCTEGKRRDLLLNLDFASALEEIAHSCNPTQVFKFLEFLALEAKAMVNCNVSLTLLWENIFLSLGRLVLQ